VLVHGDIKSCIDETVATIVLLLEAIALKLRQLPNCMFALHVFATTIVKRAKVQHQFALGSTANAGGVHDYVSDAAAVWRVR
jgi:hypothetical protein